MKLVTSPILISRLKNISDEEAWNRFYDLYSPLILAFARQKGCNASLAQDVLQETMCQLLQYMMKFDYNPNVGKFRSYLLQVVSSRIHRLKSPKIQTVPLISNDDDATIDILDQNAEDPWNAFEKLWRDNLKIQAFARVKERIKPLTWKVFELFVIENVDAEVIAKQLNVNKNTIYKYKTRVLDLLEQEIKTLEQELGAL